MTRPHKENSCADCSRSPASDRRDPRASVHQLCPAIRQLLPGRVRSARLRRPRSRRRAACNNDFLRFRHERLQRRHGWRPNGWSDLASTSTPDSASASTRRRFPPWISTSSVERRLDRTGSQAADRAVHGDHSLPADRQKRRLRAVHRGGRRRAQVSLQGNGRLRRRQRRYLLSGTFTGTGAATGPVILGGARFPVGLGEYRRRDSLSVRERRPAARSGLCRRQDRSRWILLSGDRQAALLIADRADDASRRAAAAASRWPSRRG